MCYYNGQWVSKLDSIRLSNLEKEILDLQLPDRPVQSGFDYGDWLILKPEGSAHFEVALAHWEFIPSWVRDKNALAESRKKFTTLNAKGETILESKMFREAALKRRCLVLSGGFYEWKHIGKKTFPHYIGLKGREYFFMAGIWQPWTDKETGETFDTFAVLTTAANSLMENIHNTKKRMPTILTEPLAMEWLFGDLQEERIRSLATFQYPAEDMQAHTICKDFQLREDPREPFQYMELSDLFS